MLTNAKLIKITIINKLINIINKVENVINQNWSGRVNIFPSHITRVGLENWGRFPSTDRTINGNNGLANFCAVDKKLKKNIVYTKAYLRKNLIPKSRLIQ